VERLARACVEHRGRVIAVVAVAVAISALFISRGRLDTDLVGLFMEEEGAGGAYQAWRDRFDASERVLVAFPRAAPASDETLDGLERAERALGEVPGVVDALSLLSAPHAFDDGGLLKLETWGESLRAAQGPRRVALEMELLSDEDLAGALVSTDGRALAVLVEIDERFQGRPPREQLELADRLRAAVADAGLAPLDEVRAVGFPVVVSAMLQISLDHIRALIPLTGLLLIVVVLALYRRLWPAIFAVVISGLSVVFASAAAVFVDARITPLHSIAPVLIVVIALADTIFVLNAYLRALDAGLEKRAAIVHALGEVGPACVLTSVSTFFSFASFLLIPARAMQLLGISVGVGVGAALLLIVTLGPVLLDVIPTPRTKGARRGQQLTRRIVDVTRALAMGWPRSVLAFALLLLITAAAVLPLLEVETDWARRMAPSHEVPRAEAWVKEHFGGFSQIEVVWQRSGGAPLSPDVLQAQHAFARAATARPDVMSELSPATVLVRLKQALGAPDGGAPATDAEIAQLRELLAIGGGEDPLASFLSKDKDASRTVLRVAPTGIRSLAALSRNIEDLARQQAPAGVQVEVTGLSVMLGRWLDKMLAAQVRGLGLVAFMTVLILTFGLRSARAGGLALLPNSLPVLLFVASLTLPGQHFDSDYLLVCVVGLGIAVDDTIHFLTRFRAARREGMSPSDALEEAYASAGPAMVQTTLILTLGLSPLALSDYLSARMFFTELSKVLAGALFADLLLLPALIRLGWIRFSERAPASP
jgi:predicted RND superfamily exporter protein